MTLIQIFLPLYGNHGRKIAAKRFKVTAGELAQEFGGVTCYVQSPAQGLWRRGKAQLARDTLITFGVMVQKLSRKDWSAKRRRLEQQYRQERIVVRSISVNLL